MAAADHDIPDKGDLEFSPGVAYSARVNNVWQGGKDNISQVLLDGPHSARTNSIQARHSDYSKSVTFAVPALSGTYMGVMSGFSGGCS